jgi:hypothetical protein
MKGSSIPDYVTDADEREFLNAILPGQQIGNKSLREKLRWSEDRFWEVRNRLIDSGELTVGRGRGGSTIRLAQIAVAQPTSQLSSIAEAEEQVESDLYEPFAQTIQDSWSQDQGLKRVKVSITAHQGAKSTGGGWSRPDVTSVAVRKYKLLPGTRLDVYTFEIKTHTNVDIKSVFEAVAHSRAATHSYLCVHVPNGDEPNSAEWDRIQDECERLGIGLLTFSDPQDYNTWDPKAKARRNDPDPDVMEAFLSQQLDDTTQTFIAEETR